MLLLHFPLKNKKLKSTCQDHRRRMVVAKGAIDPPKLCQPTPEFCVWTLVKFSTRKKKAIASPYKFITLHLWPGLN